MSHRFSSRLPWVKPMKKKKKNHSSFQWIFWKIIEFQEVWKFTQSHFPALVYIFGKKKVDIVIFRRISLPTKCGEHQNFIFFLVNFSFENPFFSKNSGQRSQFISFAYFPLTDESSSRFVAQVGWNHEGCANHKVSSLLLWLRSVTEILMLISTR